ncbi:hypothetical protein Bbelb_222510 [Branchiostoma belcheri]|nr:hypothetical protein Bbelb_222510 [Branchiostoma belcheri]
MSAEHTAPARNLLRIVHSTSAEHLVQGSCCTLKDNILSCSFPNVGEGTVCNGHETSNECPEKSGFRTCAVRSPNVLPCTELTCCPCNEELLASVLKTLNQSDCTYHVTMTTDSIRKLKQCHRFGVSEQLSPWQRMCQSSRFHGYS